MNEARMIERNRPPEAEVPQEGQAKGRDCKRPLAGFGAYLRLIRGRQKKTQAQAAASVRDALLALQESIPEGRRKSVSQGLLAQYEAGKVYDPDPLILRALAKAYEVEHLELVYRLIRDKYDPGDDWRADNGRERWGVLEATWAQPALVGHITDPKGEVLSQGVATLCGEQLIAKAGLVANATFLRTDALAEWEKVAPVRKCWVLAPEFIADRSPAIRAAVVANLRKNPPVEYAYIIHPNHTWRFRDYLARLQAEVDQCRGGGVEVRAVIRAYKLDEAALRWLSTDHLAANPDEPERTLVFRYLRQGGEVYAHLLDKEEADALITNWKNWVKDDNQITDVTP